MNRETVVNIARAWIGKKEADKSHMEIVNVYNAHKPLARNYKVKEKDSWCATFVSAVAIKAGATDIIPTECSCQNMIGLFQKLGSWQENDAYTPQAGDVIFYDWQDDGKGDNKGWSDHVGIVETCENGAIYVIEGNYKDAVGIRKIKVNAKCIRGFGVPKYSTGSAAAPAKQEEIKVKKGKVIAFALNVRADAGTKNKIISVVEHGDILNLIDEKKVGTEIWYKVSLPNGTVGYCSGKFIEVVK